MHTNRATANDPTSAVPIAQSMMGGGVAVREDDVAALVDTVLRERLTVVPMFQPIVELAGRTVVGAEALARGPAGSSIERPEDLLRAARRAGRLREMDMLCGERALEVATQAGYSLPLIFMNAEPEALDQPLSDRMIELLRDKVSFRIVLEYTERALGTNPAGLIALAADLHVKGDCLALDDVGADPMSLALLPLLEPEVIKLDMHLLRDPYGKGTVEVCSVVTAIAERTGAVVLAEGIETETDLRHARALGATWGQGWLFGRPVPAGDLPRPVGPVLTMLRPARPGLHAPKGTPFELATAGAPSRVAGPELVDALLAQLLRDADCYGDHAVVLAASSDPAAASQWVPEMERLARRVAYAAVVGPGPTDAPSTGHAEFAVIGPHFAGALCAQRRATSIEFVLTHDRRTVESIGRAMLCQAPIRA